RRVREHRQQVTARAGAVVARAERAVLGPVPLPTVLDLARRTAEHAVVARDGLDTGATRMVGGVGWVCGVHGRLLERGGFVSGARRARPRTRRARRAERARPAGSARPAKEEPHASHPGHRDSPGRAGSTLTGRGSVADVARTRAPGPIRRQ